jgi:predicted RNA binding protein with dsRBD fold (UPF0201 family)
VSDAYDVDVQVTAPVHPTEREERVAEAITALFPGAEPTERHGDLVAETDDLSQFSELLHRYEILDTARGALFEGREGDVLSFDLKKQAAHVGRVNFAVGEPAELGDLHVRIRVHEPDVEAFVDAIAPPTRDGQPVDPD